MSKRSYVEAVLAGLDAARTAGGADATLVRLLLSIDRRESAADAMETVELAAGLSERGVVGIDLSGMQTPCVRHLHLGHKTLHTAWHTAWGRR